MAVQAGAMCSVEASKGAYEFTYAHTYARDIRIRSLTSTVPKE